MFFFFFYIVLTFAILKFIFFHILLYFLLLSDKLPLVITVLVSKNFNIEFSVCIINPFGDELFPSTWAYGYKLLSIIGKRYW